MARYDANARCVSPNLRSSQTPPARYVSLLLPSSASRVTQRPEAASHPSADPGHVARCVRALVPPARLQLALLDPQGACEFWARPRRQFGWRSACEPRGARRREGSGLGGVSLRVSLERQLQQLGSASGEREPQNRAKCQPGSAPVSSRPVLAMQMVEVRVPSSTSRKGPCRPRRSACFASRPATALYCPAAD